MKNQGFSLVELSIVLVILGLLVSGVLGGKSLIRAAELRAVASEYNQYQAAIHAFRGKYNALPGDMQNATMFWGQNGGCTASGMGGNNNPGYQGGSPMTATCNGDGSMRIGNNALNDSFHFERFLFWQHLHLSGLVPGNFTGVRGNGGPIHHIAGENVPRSKFGNAVWAVRSKNTAHAEHFLNMDYANMLTLAHAGTGTEPLDPVMPPEDAWNIDSKIDDGRPGTGNVIAFPINNNCTTTANVNDFNGQYRLEQTTVLCALNLRNMF